MREIDFFHRASAFNQDIGDWDTVGVHEHGEDVLEGRCLRPGPWLVRRQRREPGSSIQSERVLRNVCGVAQRMKHGDCQIKGRTIE